MLKIVQHIEYLLLAHESVVVPYLGTFTANYQNAHFEMDRSLATPPKKSLTFTSEVREGDDLLVQSIQKELQLQPESALALIKQDVERVQALLADGEMQFGQLGHFSLSDSGEMQFVAAQTTPIIPSLFGLEPITLQPLINLHEVWQKEPAATTVESSDSGTIVIRLSKFRLAQTAVAAAIVMIMMLVSTPIEHEVVKQDYASVLSTLVVMKPTVVEEELVATPEFVLPTTTSLATAEVVEPEIEVVEEVVEPAPMPEVKPEPKPVVVKQPTVAKDQYLVIIGSLPTRELAEQEVKNIAKRHNIADVQILYRDGRTRLYLQAFSTSAEAQSYLDRQKSQADFPFPDAWVLRSRI